MKNLQWTNEVPTKNGGFWVKHRHIRKPVITWVSDTEYDGKYGGMTGGCIMLPDGTSLKLKNFHKRFPEALWCDVEPHPPLPKE